MSICCRLRFDRLLVALFGPVIASCGPDVRLAYDLNDGTLYHDRPTPFQPDVARITSPNGEIEDMYVSRYVEFRDREVSVRDDEQDNLTLRLDFQDAESGEKQYLLVAAKHTDWPFPDTFALRLDGDPRLHNDRTLGPGISMESDRTTVEGKLAIFIFAGPGKPKTVGYTIPIRCDANGLCNTGPHFPRFRDSDTRRTAAGDLVDGGDCFVFSGLHLNFQPERILSCSSTRPGCQSVSVSSVGFSMLAGDLAILSGGIDLERLCPSR